jgi:hypothetical protein
MRGKGVTSMEPTEPRVLETVIASEAKQSIATKRKNGLLRRFRLRSSSYGGQVAPRNDARTHLRDPAAGFARGLACSFRPLRSEGAGNAGRPMRPIAACAGVVVERTRVSQVTPEIVRHSPRNGFNGFLRALPGDRAFLPPSSLRSSLLKNLMPASGHQDHTTSPSASTRSRQ